MHDNTTTAVGHLSPSTAVSVRSLTDSSDAPGSGGGIDLLPRDIAMAITYGLICVVGLVGHGLVLFAVVSDSEGSGRRAAVTNVYIVSLSLADSTFLIGLPFVIVTGLAKRWVFGSALCKVGIQVQTGGQLAGATTATRMRIQASTSRIKFSHDYVRQHARKHVIMRPNEKYRTYNGAHINWCIIALFIRALAGCQPVRFFKR